MALRTLCCIVALLAGLSAASQDAGYAEIPAHLPQCSDAANIASCNEAAVQKLVVRNVRISGRKIRKSGGGQVVIRYVVGFNGEVKDAEVAKSAHPALDAAALEAVKKLPQHVPATIGGKKVQMQFHIPVNFRVAD